MAATGAAPDTRPHMSFHGTLDRFLHACKHLKGSKSGMFGRMFPTLKPLSSKEAHLVQLGQAMIETAAQAADPARDNPGIPAGFTYFGQFVDHDITLDTTPLPERIEDPNALENFRTPGLDLDCVYGNGPEAHPFFYQRANRALLEIGETTPAASLPALPNDLPRGKQGFALIGDPRNDENLLVAQLHLCMLKFHNKVVTSRSLSFEEARKTVRLHYQWVVVHDFLPRVCDPAVLKDVLKNGRKFYKPKKYSFMPVEFAAAAYRFGHTMIPESYSHNKLHAAPPLHELFTFTGLFGDGSRVPIPSDRVIDWRRYLETGPRPSPDKLNLSRRIDPMLVPSLGSLPLGDPRPERRNLAVRNLIRGNGLGLPSGQDVAKKMRIPALTAAEIGSGADGAVAKACGFDKKTPLFYYLLKEAEVQAAGKHLGAVGSRIVAEVIIGLLEEDEASLLGGKNKRWKPDLGAVAGRFTLADLVEFVGEMNPVGN